MKEIYKGFEIEAKREESLGGDTFTYYSIFTPDDYELSCDFTSDENITNVMQDLRDTVDAFLSAPWEYIEEIDRALDELADYNIPTNIYSAEIDKRRKAKLD